MLINYTTEAFLSLTQLVNFIEEKNTSGAGIRWLNKFEEFLTAQLPVSLGIQFCQNRTFRELRLRCLYYSDWVIAFSVHPDFVLIEALIHKSRIVD